MIKNRKIFYVLGIAVLVFVLAIVLNRKDANDFKVEKVQIGNSVITVELANTEKTRVQGLSGRTSLATSTGMFFVFDRSSRWGIWMKDMNFPIDVIWITEDFKIAYIVESMLPESFPKVYVPNYPVKYILEVPAGTVLNAGAKVGQDVVVN